MMFVTSVSFMRRWWRLNCALPADYETTNLEAEYPVDGPMGVKTVNAKIYLKNVWITR